MLVIRLLKALCLAAVLAVAGGAQAGDTLRVKFRSRALLDATATGYGKDDVQGVLPFGGFSRGFQGELRQIRA